MSNVLKRGREKESPFFILSSNYNLARKKNKTTTIRETPARKREREKKI